MHRFSNKTRLIWAAATTGAAAAWLAAATPVRANLAISAPNYSYTDTTDFPGSTSIASSPNAAAVEATINADIATLESYISTNVSVNIQFVNYGSGLGASSTYYSTISYSQYYNDLKNNQTLSTADNKAISHLSTGSTNPVNGSSSITLSTPLLRALEGGSPTSTPDTVIGLNLGIMNTGRGNGSNGYDLQSTAAHEMNESLGIGGAGSQLNQVAQGHVSPTGAVGPLDLYRYSGSGVRSYTISNTASSYFSIDGGVTDLVHFNQNGYVDNSDFSDWGDGITPADGQPNIPPQVQDAYNGPTDQPNLGSTELTALDVVGWNLTSTGSAIENAPEPASLGLFAISAVGLLARRRMRLG